MGELIFKVKLLSKGGCSAIVAVALGCIVSEAQSGPNGYPDAYRVDLFKQEQLEQRRLEDLERAVVEQRAALEKRNREVERMVNAHKFNIENLKMRQDRAKEELEALKIELNHTNAKLDGLNEEHSKQTEASQQMEAYLNDVRGELENKRKSLEDAILAATRARQEYEKSIYQKSMDVQRMKGDVERLETRRIEAEALRANLEAEEMKVRTEWMQAKLAAAEKLRQRDLAVSEMNEAKARHQRAMNDLNSAKQSLASAEKSLGETRNRVKSEVARFEADIMKANRARLSLEAERIRLETEVAKLQDYRSKIAESRDEALDQQAAAEGMVLRTKVAVETARSELAGSLEKRDQVDFMAQKTAARARGLAAADESSRLFAGGRAWSAQSGCDTYDRPSRKRGVVVSQVAPGNRFLARESGQKWIELISGTGSMFVDKSCGSFE